MLYRADHARMRRHSHGSSGPGSRRGPRLRRIESSRSRHVSLDSKIAAIVAA